MKSSRIHFTWDFGGWNLAGYNNLSEGALHEVFPLLASEVATVLILQISLRRMSASPEPVPIRASTRIPFDCDDADCFVLKYEIDWDQYLSGIIFMKYLACAYN